MMREQKPLRSPDPTCILNPDFTYRLFAYSVLCHRELCGGGRELGHYAGIVLAVTAEIAHESAKDLAQEAHPAADGWVNDIASVEVSAEYITRAYNSLPSLKD